MISFFHSTDFKLVDGARWVLAHFLAMLVFESAVLFEETGDRVDRTCCHPENPDFPIRL